jgi:hypothetical protein
MQQLNLPFVLTASKFKWVLKKLVRIDSFNLTDGLEYIKNPALLQIKEQLIKDLNKRGAVRTRLFLSGKLKCVACGLEGDHFHLEKHKNDQLMQFSPYLYGWKDDEEIMMTLDHILPKSLGGSDNILNAQCMCVKCNGEKSNKLSLANLIDIASHEDAASMHSFTPYNSKKTITSTVDSVRCSFNKMGN